MTRQDADLPRPKFTLGEGDTAAQDQFDDPRYWADCIPKRIFGYLIDVVILAAVSFGLWMIAALSFGLLAPLTALLQMLLPFAYHALMVSQRGATVGQRIAGLQVVSAIDGSNPTVIQALVLTVLFYFSVFLSFLPLIYGLIDSKGRFLHDIFSGTRSVRAAALDEDAGR